jgi:S-adenosylmethionine hydrolase
MITGRHPICALITDFGSRDYFIGVLKGVIKKVAPSAEVIDICNDIPSYSLLPASFVIDKSYRYFPDYTIFLVVVDPGVGTDRKILLVEHNNYFFIGPDNGVLTPILRKKEKKVSVIDKKKFFLIDGYSTFEARDKMAPAAAYLAAGLDPQELSSTTSRFILNRDYFPSISRSNGAVNARIIYIDKFGNIMTNVTRECLLDAQEASGCSRFKAVVGKNEITRYFETYDQAGKESGSEPFMLMGSHRNLEIAVNQMSAAFALEAVIGQKVVIEYY